MGVQKSRLFLSRLYDVINGTPQCRNLLTADMRVDLGRPYAAVSQEFLDEPDVGPLFKQMRRKGVPQRMNGDILPYARLFHSILKHSLRTAHRIWLPGYVTLEHPCPRLVRLPILT